MSATPRNATDKEKSGTTLQTVNPASGENGKAYRAHTLDEARSIAADCARAQKLWRRTPMAERSRLMHAAAQVMRAGKSRYAALMTAEMGKTITDGLGEIEKCAATADYFADHRRATLIMRYRRERSVGDGDRPSPRAGDRAGAPHLEESGHVRHPAQCH